MGPYLAKPVPKKCCQRLRISDCGMRIGRNNVENLHVVRCLDTIRPISFLLLQDPCHHRHRLQIHFVLPADISSSFRSDTASSFPPGIR